MMDKETNFMQQNPFMSFDDTMELNKVKEKTPWYKWVTFPIMPLLNRKGGERDDGAVFHPYYFRWLIMTLYRKPFYSRFLTVDIFIDTEDGIGFDIEIWEFGLQIAIPAPEFLFEYFNKP